MEKTALFPGTFDPMTVGHFDILRRALPLFDRIIVAVGVNSEKHSAFPLEERLDRIRRATAGMPQVEVASYSGLTTDFCVEKQARFILRGVRNIADYEYERNIADINRRLNPDIETVFLVADPQYADISSTMVRELMRYGKNIDEYIV